MTQDIPLICIGATISSTQGEPDSGAFIYDPVMGLAVTGVQTTLAQAIFGGQSMRLVPVADISQFPESKGWVAVGFGYDYQTEPVLYLGKTQGGLLIDPSYRFPKDVPSGASVILLKQRGAWQPELNQYDDELTLTNSGVGLAAAEAAIDAAKAAGVEIRKRIKYPPKYGLGGMGGSTEGDGKLSDVVRIYGGDDIDAEVEKARQR